MIGAKKLIISRAQIDKRIRELGQIISNDYNHNPLVVVGVLNGAFIFMADLVRELDLPLEIDFVRLASYGSKTYSSGEVRLTKDIELSVRDKDVLVVEDIVDTGRSLAMLKEVIAGRAPKSIRICALIDKRERREQHTVIDYVGFIVTEGFLVGYGLDYAEQYRQYHDIYHLLEQPE